MPDQSKAGAVAFLTKPFGDDVLLAAIQHAIGRSRTALGREAALRMLRDRYASLTRRQHEVMALVVSGLLNKQVGGELEGRFSRRSSDSGRDTPPRAAEGTVLIGEGISL